MSVLVGFIDEYRCEVGAEPTCKALQVAPSSCCAAKRRQADLSPRAVRDAGMMPVSMALCGARTGRSTGSTTLEGGRLLTAGQGGDGLVVWGEDGFGVWVLILGFQGWGGWRVGCLEDFEQWVIDNIH